MSNPHTWLVAPILPVVVIDSVDAGLFIADALLQAGLRQIEVTLRSRVSLEALAAVARRFPEMKIAAGTVLEPSQIEQVRDAGATLCVSPGFTPELCEAMQAAEMPWVPGVATAGEVMRACSAGYSLVKFFPAMAAGGPPALAAIASAIRTAREGDLNFIPTGGVTPANLAQWKATGCVVAVGGTWLAREPLVQARDRNTIIETVRAARAAWDAAS